MGDIDISKAERPARVRVGGVDVERMKEFRKRFPPAAKRHLYIRDHLLFPQRNPKTNPEKLDGSAPYGRAQCWHTCPVRRALETPR
mgnify:CR=1 FL=1